TLEDDAEVVRTLRRAVEERVPRQLRVAEHDAQALEEVLGGRREHDEAMVLRLEGAARPAGVLQAASLAHHALPAVERRRELHDAERRLVERGVDPLPFPGGGAV